MEYSGNTIKNSRLSLSRKHKLADSPKTPQQNFKKQGTSDFGNNLELASYLKTPESSKFYNQIFSEESPTQNYYDHCTLSQKMLIDEDRDVIWNWDKHEHNKIIKSKNKILNEIGSKINPVLQKYPHERKKIKLGNFSEGLLKLQSLQQEKSKTSDNEKFSDPLPISCSKGDNNFSKQSSVVSNFNNNQYEILMSKENHPNIADSGFENNFKIISEKDFSDDEDTFLYQYTQAVEECDVNKKVNGTEDNFSLDYVFDNKTYPEKKSHSSSSKKKKIYSSAITKDFAKSNRTVKSDKTTSTLDYEDSFDDIFLSIDLSSLNDNKRLQFQRYNSMPSGSSITKSTSKRLVRHGSDNFYKCFQKRKIVTSPISDVTDLGVESLDNVDVSTETSLNSQIKRCSKEEVEAKRLEAKRKRLLRMKKN